MGGKLCSRDRAPVKTLDPGARGASLSADSCVCCHQHCREQCPCLPGASWTLPCASLISGDFNLHPFVVIDCNCKCDGPQGRLSPISAPASPRAVSGPERCGQRQRGVCVNPTSSGAQGTAVGCVLLPVAVGRVPRGLCVWMVSLSSVGAVSCGQPS